MIDSIMHRGLLNDLESLINKETSFIANMANSAALIRQTFNEIVWVGYYLWDAEQMVLMLGPFQGPPANTRIISRSNICLTSVFTQLTQVKQNDGQETELVIPLRQGKTIIGVLDIVFDKQKFLSQEDVDYLELCVTRLVSHHTL